MTGRRTSARNLKNRNEMEAKEKPEEDEEPLPEKRARTSTRSYQFDYSLIRRTRRSKKTAGEEEKVQTKKGHQLEMSALCQMNPVAAQKIAEKHDFKSGFRCPKCGRLFPLYQSLISHYDECQIDDAEAETDDKEEEELVLKEERKDDEEEMRNAGKDHSDDVPIANALGLRKILPRSDPPRSPSSPSPNKKLLEEDQKLDAPPVASDNVDSEEQEEDSDDEDIARALGLRKILPRSASSEIPKTQSPKKKLPEYHPKSNVTFERSKSGKDYEKEDEVCPESVIYVPPPMPEQSPQQSREQSPEQSPINKPKAPKSQSQKRKRKPKASDSDHICPEGYVACKLCYEFFPTEESLNAHERSEHPDVHSYQCTICNYCSLEKSLMTRHMRTHSGQRPYNCSVCGYAFTTKANCERHIKKRHELTDRVEIEKLIQFDEKHQKNECEQSWKLTQKTVCMHCDAKFGDFWSLRDHLKIHDKRSFYCSTCQAAFSCRSNCIAHIMQKHNIIDREIAAEMVHFDTDLSKVPKGGRISFRGKTGLKRKSLKRQDMTNSDEEADSQADGEQASEKAAVVFTYKCAICKNGFHDFKLAHDHIKYRHWKDFKGFVKTNILFSENISNETFNKYYERVKDTDNYEQQIVRPSPIWCRSEVKNYIRKKRPKSNHVHILKDSSLHSIMRNLQNHRERTMNETVFPAPLTVSDLNQLQSQKLANVEYVEVYDKDGNAPKQLAVVKNIVAPNLVTTQSEGSTPKVIYQSGEPATSTASTVAPAQVEPVTVKQVNRKNPSMGNGPIPTINGIDYYQEAPARPVPVTTKGRLIYNLAIKPAPEKGVSANFEKATTLFKTKAIVKSEEPQVVEIQPAQKKRKASARQDPKVQFTVKTNGQTFKLTEKESRKNLAKPGVFVPLDTTSIPITQTTRVESASVYVPTNVVNYEEVYTDESPQAQRSAKGTSGQTILLTQKPVKPKGSRAIEVLQGDFVEEIEVSYDDPPPPKNQKLKNLKMEYPRICPKCGKSFPWASSLRRHLLTHSGLKPYCCSMCKTTFTTKSNLERHVLRRHGIFDREGQASCVIKLSKEEAIQAAAERETKEPLVNEFPENDENIDDTFHVDNRLEDAMEHQVLVPVTDESIEEEIVDNTFIVQTTN